MMVGAEALVTLNTLVRCYVKEFNLKPKPEDREVPSDMEKAYDNLVKASQSDETDYNSVRQAVLKTVSVLRDIENNLVSHNLPDYIKSRRNIEQINSILHIGRVYPNNAIKRLKALRPTTVIVHRDYDA